MATKAELIAEKYRIDSELNKIYDEEIRQAKEAREKRLEALRKLGMIWVDALEPEHTRTTCSDDDPNNSWHSYNSGYIPRCSRCALMEFIRTGYIPDEANIGITIT